MTLLLDDEVYQVLEWQHHKPPKAPPTLTLRVRHVKSGNVYSKKVQGNRVMSEVRRRRFFEKPSVIRKRKKAAKLRKSRRQSYNNRQRNS